MPVCALSRKDVSVRHSASTHTMHNHRAMIALRGIDVDIYTDPDLREYVTAAYHRCHQVGWDLVHGSAGDDQSRVKSFERHVLSPALFGHLKVQCFATVPKVKQETSFVNQLSVLSLFLLFYHTIQQPHQLVRIVIQTMLVYRCLNLRSALAKLFFLTIQKAQLLCKIINIPRFE